MPHCTCRFCHAPLTHSFADLSMSPLSNAFIVPDRQTEAEKFYPLHAFVCDQCFLVQLGEFESPAQIFSDYAYFSSYSDSWLAHCQQYVADMISRFRLGHDSQVIEVASNDGYLLQYFKQEGIPVLGVEPAANVAKVARDKGIPTEVRFFGAETAHWLISQGYQADLLVANNVLAHVPALNDFVADIRLILKPDGVFTIEVPHLLQLILNNQFDTIYHEHFSYFSLLTVDHILKKAGLRVFDVQELPTHGGSLRLFGCRAESPRADTTTDAVQAIREREIGASLNRIEGYQNFQAQIRVVKRRFLRFLLDADEAGKSVVGYGAPAKGNTLLNYCGVGPDLMRYTVDRSPHKQGMLLPGSRIPVEAPDKIRQTEPDYVVILPWNLKAEIMAQCPDLKSWGGHFVTAIPALEIVSA
jgi:SAM-dependent methyltransferase